MENIIESCATVVVEHLEKKIIGRYVEKKASGEKNEAVTNSREKKLYKKGVMVLVYASEIYSICIAGILKNLLI